MRPSDVERPLAGIDHGIHAFRLGAAEDALEIGLLIVDDLKRSEAGHAHRHGRRWVWLAFQVLDEPLGDPLGQRGDGQKGVDPQRRRDQRAIRHEQPVVDFAVAGKHPSKAVDGALQIVLP
jgi:hypothetical protein